MKHTTKRYSRYFFASLLMLLAFNFQAFSNEEHHADAGHEEKKFDAGTMITEHISDAHDWHLWGHTAIPLPVIIYSDKGLDVFSSSRFNHGHDVVEGKYPYFLNHENKVVVVDPATKAEDHEATAKLLDFSITKNVATLFFSITVLLLVFLSVAGAYKKNPNKAPSGFQSLVEPIILFIRDDVAIPAIGKKKYEKFMPYLLTVFFFILLNNLLGLVPIAPGGANLTGNIAVTAVLACLTFIFTTINGNAHYWHHIIAMPGVPKPVLLILTPIEILGVVLRPFVLMIRLFANITAGHIIALSFFSLIFIFAEMNTGLGYGVGIFSVAFTVFMSLLEVMVAFIQAYVFTLLSAIYFGSAVEEPAHH